MEKERLTDEKITSGVGTIIDDLAKAAKQAIGQFFNMMVERTADTASDLADKGVDKLKEKIGEKGSNDDQTKTD
jgi:hypothetical protein